MAPESIDAYLAGLPIAQRAALARLRTRVTKLVPEAVETISYGLPAFKLGGRALIWFAGWKAHCSIYPLTATFVEANAEALAGYGRTKGALHFQADAPLPDELFDRFVQARLADLAEGRR